MRTLIAIAIAAFIATPVLAKSAEHEATAACKTAYDAAVKKLPDERVAAAKACKGENPDKAKAKQCEKDGKAAEQKALKALRAEQDACKAAAKQLPKEAAKPQ